MVAVHQMVQSVVCQSGCDEAVCQSMEEEVEVCCYRAAHCHSHNQNRQNQILNQHRLQLRCRCCPRLLSVAAWVSERLLSEEVVAAHPLAADCCHFQLTASCQRCAGAAASAVVDRWKLRVAKGDLQP